MWFSVILVLYTDPAPKLEAELGTPMMAQVLNAYASEEECNLGKTNDSTQFSMNYYAKTGFSIAFQTQLVTCFEGPSGIVGVASTEAK
jgi:hypothetical protein